MRFFSIFSIISCLRLEKYTINCNIIINRQISKRTAIPIILDIQKNRCLMCNQKFRRMVPHEFHHVDHNRHNNTLYNFAALCANCHGAHHRHDAAFPYIKHMHMFLH
jgi:uncharacterized protein with PIN domain